MDNIGEKSIKNFVKNTPNLSISSHLEKISENSEKYSPFASKILKTKFNFPKVVQDFIPKAELLGKLNEGTNKKLTIVSGFPGSGKTTYLGYWADLHKADTSWISLSETDNSVNTLLILLISAIQQIKKGFCSDLINILQTTNKVNIEYILTLLINELQDERTHLNIIFDDFHLINITVIKNGLNFFIENLPQNVHLFFSSRNEVQFDCFSKLRINDEVIEISHNDLKFSTEQIISFFQKNKFHISQAQAEILENKSEGMILFIRIALLELDKSEKENVLITDKKFESLLLKISGKEHLISEYFNEIIKRINEKEKEFLLKTSLFPKFDKKTIHFLMGKDTQDLIYWLLNNNFILVNFDKEKEYFFYHHIFSDFLKEYFLKNNPFLFIETNKMISNWYKDIGLFQESLYYAFNSTDIDFFIDNISSSGFRMISDGNSEILRYFIEKLSQEKIQSDFYLSVYYSWIKAEDFQIEHAERLLKNAEKILKTFESDKTSFEKSMTYFVHTLISGKMSNHFLIAKYSKKIINNENELNGILLGNAYFSLGYSFLLQKNTKKALFQFSKSASFHKTEGNILSYLRSKAFIARCFLYEGELIQAKKFFEETIEEYLKYNLEKHFDLFSIYTDLARINCFFNDKDESLKYLKLASYYINLPSSSNIYYYLAVINIKIAFKEFEEAEKAINEAKDLVIKKGMESYFNVISSLESLLHIFQGKAYLAKEWAIETGKRIEEKITDINEINIDGAIYIHFDLYPLVLYYLVNQNYYEGMKLLNTFYKIINHLKIEPIMIGIFILQAIFLSKTGDMERSKEALKQALLLGEKQNYAGLFVNELDSSEILKIIVEIRQENSKKPQNTFFKNVLNSLHTENIINTKKHSNPLSKKEQEVLNSLRSNSSIIELSQSFELSVNTLKTHLKRIYKKLNVKNKNEAILKAINEGYIKG